MKRNNILSIIAFALLLLYGIFMANGIIGILVLVGLFLFLLRMTIDLEFFTKRRVKDEDRPFERTVDDLTAVYGEPEDVILVNATRANEALGVILVYKDFFIIEGRRVEKSAIRNVTFNNSGTPYTPAEYQVIIAIGETQSDYLHINVGYDAAWANDVAELIRQNIRQDNTDI